MKPHKIKSYYSKRSFSPKPPRSPWKIILAIVLVVALVFVGISLYGPVSDFIKGRTEPTPRPEPPTPEPTPPATSEVSKAPEPEPEPEPEKPTLGESMHIQQLPVDTATDPAKLETFLSQLPEDCNAVVLQVKDPQGRVYYASENESAKQWEALTANPLDFSSVAKTVQDNGLFLIAQLSVFSDPVAARGDLDNAVMHNSGVIWLDNALASGGKPWTTPYSAKARAYNADLAKELTALGADMILLDNVRFPYDPTHSATFGGDGSETPAEALKNTILAIETAAEVPVGLVVPFDATLADAANNQAFYGGSPQALTEAIVALDLRNTALGDTNELPPQVLESLATLESEKKAVILLISAEQFAAKENLPASYIVYTQ